MPSQNYITSLHNFFQDKHQAHLIAYSDVSSGPPHAPTWTSECRIGGELKGSGIGVSKNEARQLASKEALASVKGEARTSQ